jgi:putative flippase GtrA
VHSDYSAQVFRFVLVGLVNTLVGYSLYALFVYIGFGYVYALGMATVLGILFNFHTIGKLVFGSSNYSLIVKFIIVYAIVFGLNVMLIEYMIRLRFSAYVAGASAIIPSAAISFILNKYFVFKR